MKNSFRIQICVYLVTLGVVIASLFSPSSHAIDPEKSGDAPRELSQWSDAEGWTGVGFDTSDVDSPGEMHEPDWSEWLATEAGLDPDEVCEVVLSSKKRVDILTDHEAIEVEWVGKWYEAVGQSLHYSLRSGRKPAIILLYRASGREHVEIGFCRNVCKRAGIRLYIQRVPSPEVSSILPIRRNATLVSQPAIAYWLRRGGVCWMAMAV